VTVLERALGRATAAHLSALASGRDERRVSPRMAEKSIGAEETFAHDIGDSDVIRRELLRLSGRTARGLRGSGYAARTVVVKLRLASFKTITRSRTLADPTDVAQQIYLTACDLYETAGLDPQALLRLVGVRATGLVPVGTASTQLAFGDQPAAWREAEQALDRIAGRFGTDTVRPATLVDSGRQEHGPGPESGGGG
jgi:DNA polymerase-4